MRFALAKIDGRVPALEVVTRRHFGNRVGRELLLTAPDTPVKRSVSRAADMRAVGQLLEHDVTGCHGACFTRRRVDHAQIHGQSPKSLEQLRSG